MTKTTAELVGEQLGDDGETFVTIMGVRLLDPERCYGGETVHWRGDSHRHTYKDGSVITVAGDYWDYGFPGCFCWQGAGHNEDCPQTYNRD